MMFCLSKGNILGYSSFWRSSFTCCNLVIGFTTLMLLVVEKRRIYSIRVAKINLIKIFSQLIMPLLTCKQRDARRETLRVKYQSTQHSANQQFWCILDSVLVFAYVLFAIELYRFHGPPHVVQSFIFCAIPLMHL